MDKVVFKEFNFGYMIEIKEKNGIYHGFINGYPLFWLYDDFEDCLRVLRMLVSDMPMWLRCKIEKYGLKKEE